MRQSTPQGAGHGGITPIAGHASGSRVRLVTELDETLCTHWILVPLIMSYPTQYYPRMPCKARLLQLVLQTNSLRSYRRCLSSGCHTESHRLGGLNNRNQFSYSSGAWKSKIWVQGLLWDTFWLALLHHVSISQREEEIFFICLPYKAVVLSE